VRFQPNEGREGKKKKKKRERVESLKALNLKGALSHSSTLQGERRGKKGGRQVTAI